MLTVQEYLRTISWKSVALLIEDQNVRVNCRSLFRQAMNLTLLPKNTEYVLFGEELPNWSPDRLDRDFLIRVYDAKENCCDEMYGHAWKKILGWLVSDHTRRTYPPEILGSAILKEAELSEFDSDWPMTGAGSGSTFSLMSPLSLFASDLLTNSRQKRHMDQILNLNRQQTEKHLEIIRRELKNGK